MTTPVKHLVGVFLIAILMLLGVIGMATSCRTSAPAAAGGDVVQAEMARTPLTQGEPASLVTVSTVSRAVMATRPLSPTQIFLAPVLQMEGQLTPMQTSDAARFAVVSPTPTVSLAELLSDTIEVQTQLAVSMATMARALTAMVQPPLTTTTTLSPNLLLSLTAVLSDAIVVAAPVTVTNGNSPALTITASLTQTSLYPVPAPPAQLPPDGEVRRAYVPILMYHYLSIPPADTDIYRRDLSVSPAGFAAQLDRLQAEGYTTISLYALYEYLTQGTPLPPKPVIITFDDGYRDNYENALPLLTARNMTATFFIVIDFINRERPEYLNWEMVRALHAAGMSIEAHGVDHTTLRGRAMPDLEYQALRSYETIQDRIGVRPRFISYPAGEYDAATITMFQNAGYWAGFTTIQGATQRGDELFTIRRVRIRNTTTADDLMNLLTADW